MLLILAAGCLFVGLIAGWLAGKIVRGTGFGIIGDILVGIAGALCAGCHSSFDASGFDGTYDVMVTAFGKTDPDVVVASPGSSGTVLFYFAYGITINARFQGLTPANGFGPEYLTYVLWAISPDGRPQNLGEILPAGTNR